MSDPNTTAGVDVSIVVSLHNQEDTLEELHDELTEVMKSSATYEVIYIDDGSHDRTGEVLKNLFGEDDHVRVIIFARHFGQQIATMAGLDHVRGDKVVILDPQTQVALSHIPEILKPLDEGYDVVYGDSRNWSLPIWRRVGRIAAKRLIQSMTGIAMPPSVSGLIALNNDLVQVVNRYQERKRSLDSLIAYLAYGRHTTIPVTPRSRGRLHAKVSLWGMVRAVLSIVIAHSNRPLQLAFWAGCWVMALAALLVVYTIYRGAVSGMGAAWPALIVTLVTGLSAIQLMAIGVLGEYVGRIYGEVREQPLYTVAEVFERDPADAATVD